MAKTPNQNYDLSKVTIAKLEDRNILLEQPPIYYGTGYSVVFRGTQNAKIVALKLVAYNDSSQKEELLFARRNNLLLNVRHPNICVPLEVFDVQGFVCVLMKYYPYNMSDIIHQRKSSEVVANFEQRFVKWFKQIAESIMFLHSQNVLHGDIKPTNVFIDEYDNAVVTDYGIARVNYSNMSAIVVTMDYQAQEQCYFQQYDHAADVFSIGMMAIEVYSGNLPFKLTARSQQKRVLAKHKFDFVAFPSELGNLGVCLRQMLNPDPVQRPSLSDFVLQLDAWFDNYKFLKCFPNAGLQFMQEEKRNVVATAMPSTAKSQSLADFEIIKVIGSGGQGVVNLGKRDGQLYAIKQGYSLNLTEIQNEIKKFQMLKSDKVVKFIESFYDQDKLYIVQEYLKFGDLTKLVDYYEGSQIPESLIVQVFHQMVDALKVLSDYNIVHRDIKPQNILISQFDPKLNMIEVKLADFGLAKEINTMTASLAGTPCYIAPEVWDVPEAEKKFSFMSDIYALGASLSHLANLKAQFIHENIQGTMLEIMQYQKPLEIPDCYSEELKSIVALLTHPDPEKRASIEQLTRINCDNNALTVTQELQDAAKTMKMIIIKQSKPEKQENTFILDKQCDTVVILQNTEIETFIIRVHPKSLIEVPLNCTVTSLKLENFQLLDNVELGCFRALSMLSVVNVQGNFCVKTSFQQKFDEIRFENCNCFLDLSGIALQRLVIVKTKFANLIVNEDTYVSDSKGCVLQGIGETSEVLRNILADV